MIKAIAQIIICAIAFYQQAIAQIIVTNKEMEGTKCIAFVGGSIDTFVYLNTCSLSGFFLCDSFVSVIDNTFSNPTTFYPAFPYSGQTCIMISDVSNTLKGSLSTFLSCSLKRNREYQITYWAADFFNLDSLYNKKTLQIWGNTDTCNRIEKIYESEGIDTGWHQYTAILTPKLQDYEFIHFRIGITSVTGNLQLDALSDIYPFNANDVTATIQDTAFAKANSTCIELSATANIATYDTVYWQDAAGNKIADGFSGGIVCPDSSTYYVIAMRDSVQDCAGIWWSYDTVKVTVNTGTAVATPAGSEAYGVNIFPNPAKDNLNLTYLIGDNENLSVKVTNLLGQEVLSNKPLSVYGADILNISTLSNGIYFLKIQQNGQHLETKKFLIEE